jgi:nucleoside-diphosphate-sugar epimerase
VGVITIFIRRLLAGQPPSVFGDGEQRRDFVHVNDIVSATVRALEADVSGEVFNVGTGVATSVNEVAGLLCRQMAPDISPQHAPAQPGELRYSIADISKARRLLNYAPQHRLGDEIANVVEWHRMAAV